jgi:hypothetical protein
VICLNDTQRTGVQLKRHKLLKQFSEKFYKKDIAMSTAIGMIDQLKFLSVKTTF